MYRPTPGPAPVPEGVRAQTEPVEQTPPRATTRPSRNVAEPATTTSWYRPRGQTAPVAESYYPPFIPQPATVPGQTSYPHFQTQQPHQPPVMTSSPEPLFTPVDPFRPKRWGRATRPVVDPGVRPPQQHYPVFGPNQTPYIPPLTSSNILPQPAIPYGFYDPGRPVRQPGHTEPRVQPFIPPSFHAEAYSPIEPMPWSSRPTSTASHADINPIDRIQELEAELHRLRFPGSSYEVKNESGDVSLPPSASAPLPEPRPLSTGAATSSPPLPSPPDDVEVARPTSSSRARRPVAPLPFPDEAQAEDLEHSIRSRPPSTSSTAPPVPEHIETSPISSRRSSREDSASSLSYLSSPNSEPTSNVVYNSSGGPRPTTFNIIPQDYLPYNPAPWGSSPALTPLPPPVTSMKTSSSSYLTLQTFMLIGVFFVFDSVPRQVYLHLLLRIPSLYFSRVTRVFEDAQLSLPDIKRMARARADQWTSKDAAHFFSVQADMLPPSLLNFRSSWETFIDSLMREWKTLNIISVLLLSAILTVLQIDAAANQITRTSALFSLICALMSLLYGCMYIIRFGTMRKMHKASSFATEAQKRTANIWWNIWVLLAMPAIWLSWSIITFFMCIMSMIWLSGSADDKIGFTASSRDALGPRIGLTVVFSVGLIYFALIVKTFHRYGDPLDREWMRRVKQWTMEGLTQAPYVQAPYVQAPYGPQPPFGPYNTFDYKAQDIPVPQHNTRLSHIATPGTEPGFFKIIWPITPLTTRPSAFFKPPMAYESESFPPLDPITVMQLRDPAPEFRKTDPSIWQHAVGAPEWDRFVLDVTSAWNGQLVLTRYEQSTSDVDLPTYTVLSPWSTRPENPIPTSDASRDRLTFNPRADSKASSDTSYVHIKTSTYSTNNFVAPQPTTEEQDATPRSARSPTPPPRSAQGDGPPPLPKDPSVRAVRDFIDLWNERYFRPRNLEASLVPLPDSESSGPAFAVNLASLPTGGGPGDADIDGTAPSTESNSTESHELHQLSSIQEETEDPSTSFTATEVPPPAVTNISYPPPSLRQHSVQDDDAQHDFAVSRDSP